MKISSFISRLSSYQIKRLHKKNETDPYEANPDLLITEDSSFGVLEAYRMTRTNIMYSGADKKCPVVAIASAAPHEGKSLSCANLAISFALSGNKVLIIDGDMRAPKQHKLFLLGNKVGLSEYLAGIEKDPAVQQTKYNGLSLLTAGKCPPNPAELLGNDRLVALIEKVREEYDVIFIDLPPVALIADAAIVSRVADGYIMVVKAAQSDSRLIKAALEALDRVEGKVYGFLLNGIESKRKKYGRYSYYHQYSSYGYGYGRKASKEFGKKPETDGGTDTSAEMPSESSVEE